MSDFLNQQPEVLDIVRDLCTPAVVNASAEALAGWEQFLTDGSGDDRVIAMLRFVATSPEFALNLLLGVCLLAGLIEGVNQEQIDQAAIEINAILAAAEETHHGN